MTDDRMMPPEEVAELLGVSEAALRKWRAEGAGPPYVRLGYRTVRYRHRDVMRFLRVRTEAK